MIHAHFFQLETTCQSAAALLLCDCSPGYVCGIAKTLGHNNRDEQLMMTMAMG
jgi:hypothetical protein